MLIRICHATTPIICLKPVVVCPVGPYFSGAVPGVPVDVRAGTWVLPKVPGTLFQSYLLGLLRGVYRQTKYVSGASDNIIDEYAIVINMACGGALVMML